MSNVQQSKRIGDRSKPEHAARAVDIKAIWPEIPAGDLTKRNAAAVAGSKGRSAAPMESGERQAHYTKQGNRGGVLTPAQYRRWIKKLNAQLVKP